MAGDIPDVYLRFNGFTGECNDKKHLGEDGWITIKSFSFGFGFEGKDAPADDEDDSTTTPNTNSNGTAGNRNATPATQGQKPKSKKKRTPGMKSGPMTFDAISFTKGSDAMSPSLMDACYDGREIDEVELHACRYGGGPNNEKVPFLYLVFKNVYLKTCKLNLATEGLPSEDIEFQFGKVEMKCMWTDNATGNPLDEQPITAGWDLQAQAELTDDVDKYF